MAPSYDASDAQPSRPRRYAEPDTPPPATAQARSRGLVSSSIDAPSGNSRGVLTVLVAWAAVAVGMVWLVEIGGVYGIYIPAARLVSVAMAAAAVAIWAVVAIRIPDWRPRSAIWPALALPLGAFAVSTVLSQRFRVSVEYLGYTVLLVAMYLLLRALLFHAAFRDRITSLLIPLAVGLDAIFILACLGHWMDWWNAVGAFWLPPLRPDFEGFTYGNPSAVLAGSVLLTLSAVAHLGFDTAGRRAAAGALVLLTAVVALLSGSRAGWLALAVTILVVVAVGLVRPDGRRRVTRVFKVRAARIGLLVMTVAVAAAAIAMGPWILQRANAGGEDLRVGYVAIAGRLFAEAPVTGVGAGGWVADRIAMTASGETDYYIPHAHNIYAQTAAEHGLLGLLAGAVAIACLGWLIWGGLRDPNGVRRRWAWAALFGSVYFGVHQLLDFYANFPALLFAFALPVAWLDATAPTSITAGLRRVLVGNRARRLAGMAGAAAAAVIITASVVGLAAQEGPAQSMSDGLSAAERGDWAAALPLLRAANDADPAMPAYAFARGLAEAHAGDPAQALASLQAVAASDDLPVAWLDVAALRQDAGDAAGARGALDEAMRLGNQQPAILFAGGALMERAGDTAGADAAWAQALTLLPSLAGDPWWLDPARAARWPGIRDAALAYMSPELAADLWLSSGNPANALASAAQIADPTARERTQLAIAAWGGTAQDRAALDAYARNHPFDLVAVAWAGRVAARADDTDAVDRYRLWADTDVGGASEEVGEVGVAPTGTVNPGFGLTGSFWGQYTYRRPTPGDQLVPGLPYLTRVP